MAYEVNGRKVMDRRVGRRVRAALPITWRYRREVSGVGLAAAEALIVDVSVSGARIMAPTSRDLAVGALVEIELENGSRAMAIIRRYEVGGVPGRGFYGVEFVDVDDRFRAMLFTIITAALPEIEA